MQTKFSVVIPAYNREKVITDALDSVMSQTRLDCIGELMVVNDGSKDNTKAVAEEWASIFTGLCPIEHVL